MEMDKEVLDLTASRLGLEPRYLSYDLELHKMLETLLDVIKEEKLKAWLYGGTALNKGYFKEKQRLSIDIDLETETMPQSVLSEIASGLRTRKIKAELGSMRLVGNVSTVIIPTIAGQKIRIEAAKRSLKVGTALVDLHSILEYAGIPVSPVRGYPSYPFEYLLSRKLFALSVRLIYKDMYDTLLGLDLADPKKLVKYVDIVGDKENWDIIDCVRYNFEKGNFEKNTEFYYSRTPLSYRRSVLAMENEILHKINGIWR